MLGYSRDMHKIVAATLGFLFAGATMGQLLSLPMILIGAWLIIQAKPQRHA